jgi:hypothetical protein
MLGFQKRQGKWRLKNKITGEVVLVCPDYSFPTTHYLLHIKPYRKKDPIISQAIQLTIEPIRKLLGR